MFGLIKARLRGKAVLLDFSIAFFTATPASLNNYFL